MASSPANRHTLGDRLAALRDPELRVRYVQHELRRLSPEEVVELLALASGRASLRSRPHPELFLALTVALSDLPDIRAQVRQAAANRGQAEVLQLLQRPDPENAPVRKTPERGGRPLTLGERKALARRNDRDLIARALRDPHPDVIAILLGNPTVTEDDIVRMCARRPLEEATVRVVFRHTKWIVRYRVRRALALNPNTPLDVSLPLAPQLTASDRRLVASSEELASELRAACRTSLQ
ncbi:MAG: hypothetical protein AAGF12_14280 [Myxococcota bacterium]